jgi:hypothetical protein
MSRITTIARQAAAWRWHSTGHRHVAGNYGNPTAHFYTGWTTFCGLGWKRVMLINRIDTEELCGNCTRIMIGRGVRV